VPADRKPGMDHPHYPWSSINTRAPLRWPDGNTLALCLLVSLNHMEWEPPEGSFQAHNLAGGLGRRRGLDYARLTHREYGHRVGIFRVLECAAKHGVPVNLAMDALTAEHYPTLVRHCLDSGAELIGHGISVSRMITSRMSETEEREYIAKSLESLERVSGNRPKGWFGPEHGESLRTPALLADAGINHVFDWTNDEQPYRMSTPTGELYALPLMLELDDVNALWDRNVSLKRYEQLLIESAQQLALDGKKTARTLVLHIHPWLIGQPFRIGALDRALTKMLAIPGLIASSSSDIVDWTKESLS